MTKTEYPYSAYGDRIRVFCSDRIERGTWLSTIQQRNSLRFYQGSIDEYEITIEKEHQKYTSSFYTKKGAYNVLNMLLCPGMSSEYARIVEEKKNLPIMLVQQMEEIFQIYKDIFEIMCEDWSKRRNSQYVYRMQSREMLEAGYTFGFTSCSLNKESGVKDEQLRKKAGLLLLEWSIPTGIPYVLLNEILGNNRFAYQNELLLPPFARLKKKKELPFTKKELEYRDANGGPPKAKYCLEITGMDLDLVEDGDKNFLRKEEIDFAVYILEKLRSNRCISDKEKEQYGKWKCRLQSSVKDCFKSVYQRER